MIFTVPGFEIQEYQLVQMVLFFVGSRLFQLADQCIHIFVKLNGHFRV